MKRTVYSAVYDVSAKDTPINDIKEGVYIEDINGGLWEPVIWDGSVKPNSIAVINKRHSFKIALTQSNMFIMTSVYDSDYCKLSNMVDDYSALKDFSGLYNTQEMLKSNPKKDYAAGWCDAYTFPDGVTKGYLPALGELYLAYKNKRAIDAALAKCGGTAMYNERFINYYSSTSHSHGKSGVSRDFWQLCWYDGHLMDGFYVNIIRQVRPFAEFCRRSFT